LKNIFKHTRERYSIGSKRFGTYFLIGHNWSYKKLFLGPIIKLISHFIYTTLDISAIPPHVWSWHVVRKIITINLYFVCSAVNMFNFNALFIRKLKFYLFAFCKIGSYHWKNPSFYIEGGKQENHLSWRWCWRLLPELEAYRGRLHDAKEEFPSVGFN
jgi:hypothetical protein